MMLLLSKIDRARNGRSLGASGFSLVEILVGLVIGLMSTLVIVQVQSSFEGNKRSTTGGADAQTGGTLALYNIQRDGQMAGYGLAGSSKFPALRCNPLPAIDHDNNPATAALGFYPVEIAFGSGAASDQLTFRYGDTQLGGVAVAASLAGAVATVGNNLGCKAGDVALLISGANCAARQVASLSGTTGVTLATTPAIASGGLACMGNWNEITYSVNNEQLLRNGVPVVENVVAMQAEYGLSASATSNPITSWSSSAAVATLTDRQRFRAVRVALVVRSSQFEKEVVSQACNTSDIRPNQTCIWANGPGSPQDINLSALGSDWDHYRYRIFEVIIPIRNMVWMPKS